ncbi:MAG: hypothetical protein J6C84_03555 [Lachnospiraceae bacterium]|nr:hypothetical protein [Lachnospiraceae bacterium]
MENKTREKRQNVWIGILRGAIVLTCIALVIVAIFTIKEYYDTFSATYSEKGLYWALESENYYRVAEGRHVNLAEGHPGNASMKEYYGVGKYYEAAVFYYAYRAVEDEKRASKYREQMEAALPETGSLSMVKDRIHEQIEQFLAD